MTGSSSPRRRARLLWLVLPVLALLLWDIAPLITGSKTLFLRDTFNTHLEMKHAQAEAMREGYLPTLDRFRAGGQPLLGNLNAVPLYPDNLLFLVAPLLWAHNAHFWLHWLLAPWALFALSRALGLDRQAAWAGGVCFALCGFYVSQLSFYNLIGGATLIPAFAAACVFATRSDGSRRRRAVSLVAVGLLWTLMILAGDPFTTMLGLGCGVSAVLGRPVPAGERRWPAWRSLWRLGLALAAGTLAALPQLVEMARILDLSYRGHWGYGKGVRTIASFDPRQAAEWLVPFIFGRPDRIGGGAFWGQRFYTDAPAYYFTLYPGLLALALAVAAGLPRWRWTRGASAEAAADEAASAAAPETAASDTAASGRVASETVAAEVVARPSWWAASWWAWLVAGAGVFFALGRFNPAADFLLGLVPTGLVRYPIKFWVVVPVGLSVLCAIGWRRSMGDGGRLRRLVIPLAVTLAALGSLWLFLSFAPGPATALLRGLIPPSYLDVFVDNERIRWAGLSFLSAAVAAALLLALGLARRRRTMAAVLLLVVHTAAQLFFLTPAMATDQTALYTRRSPVLDHIPEDAIVAHGAFVRLFGDSTLIRGEYPGGETHWYERRAFFELYPFAGTLWNRRYELNVSAEGLDSFFAHIAAADIGGADTDADRVRPLASWGVSRLLTDRALDESARGLVRELATYPSFGHTLHVYEVLDPAPEVVLATRVQRAPNLTAAIWAVSQPEFDRRRSVVLPSPEGSEPDLAAEERSAKVLELASSLPPDARARWQVVGEGPESLRVVTDSPLPGVLMWQRAWLPLYRATVDGEPVTPVVANALRLGVEVPEGRHEVRLWVDRRPFQWSLLGTLAGLVGLALLALRVRRG